MDDVIDGRAEFVNGLLTQDTSGSFALDIAITGLRPTSDRGAGGRPRAADPVASLALPLPAGRPLPTPLEWRRGRIPVGGDRLEPGDDLRGGAGMLARQRPAFEDPRDALGPVPPGPAQRRISGHDAVREPPADERRRL